MPSRKEKECGVHQLEASSSMVAMASVEVLAEVPQRIGSRDTMMLTVTCPNT